MSVAQEESVVSCPPAAKNEVEKRPRIGRPIRIVFGFGFIALSGWVLTPRFWNITSTQAVVNARIISLSAPIAGTVTLSSPPVGQAVTAGSTLLRIDDVLTERGHLEELKSEAASLSERVAALQEHHSKMEKLKEQLALSARNYHDATIRRIEHELEEARAAAASADAMLRQHQDEMERSQAIFQRGFGSRREMITAQLAVEAAQFSADQAKAAVARISDQLASVKKGTFIGLGDGRNDVTYSQQRIHEIVIQQLHDRAQIQEHSVRIAQIKRQLQVEEERVQRRTSFSLKAPIDGIVWRRFVSTGSAVASHTELMQLLDPSDLFVGAIIHEDYLDEIQPGDKVSIKLMGSRAEVPGVVNYVLGRGIVRDDRMLAAAMPQPGTKEILVIVTFERASDMIDSFRQYHIGQRAEIILPRKHFTKKYM
jgi:multidrug resistance efflux pump